MNSLNDLSSNLSYVNKEPVRVGIRGLYPPPWNLGIQWREQKEKKTIWLVIQGISYWNGTYELALTKITSAGLNSLQQKKCWRSIWHFLNILEKMFFQNIKTKLNSKPWMTLKSSVVIFLMLLFLRNGSGTQKLLISAFQNHLQTKSNLHIFFLWSQFISAISIWDKYNKLMLTNFSLKSTHLLQWMRNCKLVEVYYL